MSSGYATKPSSILLAYLSVRSELEGERKFSLSEVYIDFGGMENLFDCVRVFNCIQKDPRHNPEIRKALNELNFNRFVNFDLKDSAYVEITALGKLFGEDFELPPEISEYLNTVNLSARLSTGRMHAASKTGGFTASMVNW
jgi:hypothetical protein